jgi:hypothetical protein
MHSNTATRLDCPNSSGKQEADGRKKSPAMWLPLRACGLSTKERLMAKPTRCAMGWRSKKIGLRRSLAFETRAGRCGWRTPWITLVCATTLAVSVGVNAQISQEGSQRALVGLDSIAFFVEPFDDDDKSCGITEALVRDAFLYPISSSRLHVSKGFSGPVFDVRITTILQRQPRQCFSSVTARVFDFQNVPVDFAHGAIREVALVLWDNERLLVSSPSDHSGRIRTAVRESTEKFLMRWNLANPPVRQ